MALIRITDFNLTTQALTLDDGISRNGHTHVDADEVITWQVQNRIGIYIHAIIISPKAGNTNIFSSQPRALDRSGKNWQAHVDYHDNDGDVYVYSIQWALDGTTNYKTFDPIISMRPTRDSLVPVIGTMFGLVGIAAAGVFFFRMRRMEAKLAGLPKDQNNLESDQ